MATDVRVLLKEMVVRDVKARYAGSSLGLLWAFAHPVLWMLLYTGVFSLVLRVPVEPSYASFPEFLMAGLLPWMAIHEGVLRGSTAITDNAELVKKLSFPSEVLVLAVALAALLHQSIATAIFAAVLAVQGELSVATLPLLLIAVPLQTALALGLGLLLASVHVFFRDTAQILGLVFNAWFYLTPIVYPLEMVPERYRALIAANPLTHLVELYRQAFLGPSLALPAGVGWLALFAAALLGAGLLLFRRLRPAFVDQI